MTTDEERLTVVNVVASTRVAEELDLPDIAIQLNCEYEPEQFPGVVYRVTEPKLAILMFRSGRAVCTGGKNEDNIHTGIERMINDLRAAGIETWNLDQVEIEVQNMVATYALHYPEDYPGNDKFTGEPQAGVLRVLEGGLRGARAAHARHPVRALPLPRDHARAAQVRPPRLQHPVRLRRPR